MLGKVLLVVGCAVLLHSARSVIEYREFMEASGGSLDSHLPLDMYVEIALGLLVGMLGSVTIAGTLKPLQAKYEAAKLKYEDLVDVKSFRVLGAGKPKITNSKT